MIPIKSTVIVENSETPMPSVVTVLKLQHADFFHHVI